MAAEVRRRIIRCDFDAVVPGLDFAVVALRVRLHERREGASAHPDNEVLVRGVAGEQRRVVEPSNAAGVFRANVVE